MEPLFATPIAESGPTDTAVAGVPRNRICAALLAPGI
jgi:hypothetical protein